MQALEEAPAPVAHLAYERNEDVIVMKGYKFARAKVAAAAAFGCMALVDERVASFAIQVRFLPAACSPVGQVALMLLNFSQQHIPLAYQTSKA